MFLLPACVMVAVGIILHFILSYAIKALLLLLVGVLGRTVYRYLFVLLLGFSSQNGNISFPKQLF